MLLYKRWKLTYFGRLLHLTRLFLHFIRLFLHDFFLGGLNSSSLWIFLKSINELSQNNLFTWV